LLSESLMEAEQWSELWTQFLRWVHRS